LLRQASLASCLIVLALVASLTRGTHVDGLVSVAVVTHRVILAGAIFAFKLALLGLLHLLQGDIELTALEETG